MASVDTGGGEEKKGKPKKQTLRVDFTPMVDMNMLLITFFMFCTTLSKPQIMDIAMPTDEKLTKEDEVKVKESKAITLILGEDDKVYYYTGIPDYTDYQTLKETTYAAQGGLRDLLLERNAPIVAKMRELRLEKFENKKMSDEEFKTRSREIKGVADGQVVVIKPTSEATYKNLVDALDEMQICSIDKYAIVDMSEGDQYLVENLKTKGAYGAEAAPPRK
ncbi:biopolymer transport protein ExbD [Dysgonomonas sp. PFB1-18]|uniref:ExbD/TolR family protein n=1 Tax=unclassified Dysgonomonas TaxID=2630389 RepID=UPI002475FCF9|nr:MULTISPECIES: biopolymer transporter ExbD [unclassified Dysgonomonas]MDH6308347.1 biopolymer transport protein ExbD [Dysgonomonas sp. PF1-14]MDH6338216.1 biopolymer transport protein ExbD [Dysgonomonas sp. PF1-16]MDH6379713.1 biopolymer transport protein ExbD [Dysgonomonas sp. PFB1-18]MDH6397198.1 biopolymer transport protein ExbD [Dysgonomonas sp. PF1-23]